MPPSKKKRVVTLTDKTVTVYFATSDDAPPDVTVTVEGHRVSVQMGDSKPQALQWEEKAITRPRKKV